MINRLPQLGENMNSMTFHDLSVFDHFFFDLDGTLADSKADVLGSIEQAYRNLGFAYDKSRLKIGPLLPEIIASISPQLDENQRALAAQLDTLLPLYHRWGIKGIKFGFVQVGSHMWTKWMHEAVKKCARYQLMVDIHSSVLKINILQHQSTKF